MIVLGISPAHDSSVCVLNNGEVDLFFKEERLTRNKRDNLPYLSLTKIQEIYKSKIDYCVIASPTPLDYNFNSLSIFVNKIFKCPVEYMCNEHHKQHAALAFENSDFDTALIFVIDRNGSFIGDVMRESESIFIGEKNPYSISEIYKNFWASNLGETYTPQINQHLEILKNKNPNCKYVCKSSFNVTKVYESATSLIGQHPLENGKTMGLASYGKNDLDFPNLFYNHEKNDEYLIPFDHYFIHKIKHFSEVPISIFSNLEDIETFDITEDNHQVYSNYAYQVQKQTQEQILNLISIAIKKTNIKNVVITGGYGLNIVSNSYYVKNLPDVNFFFEPMSDDTGNSIGAAIYTYKKKTNDINNYKLKDTFFHGVEHSLDNVDGNECDENTICDLIIDQKSVAVYHGLSESGNRALGNRSILFDARNKDAKKTINKIKNREWYRPFAAIVLEEYADEYFDMIGLKKSEFMTNSFNVRCNYKSKIPGVVHVDDSCRIQTIDKNSHLYHLLKLFHKKTGVGLLLNTSFNLSGEPLVETPQEAIDVFNRSNIDYLWFPKIKKYLSKTSSFD